MINLFHKFKTNQKGFTLFELLVVLIIIGILLTIFLPRIDFASDKTRQMGVKSDFKEYATSFETYFRTSAGIIDIDEINTWLDEENQIDKTSRLTKKEDPWGEEYIFRASGTAPRSKISLYSVGKTGGDENSADFEMHVYYNDGKIGHCTKGFGSDNKELSSNIAFDNSCN